MFEKRLNLLIYLSVFMAGSVVFILSILPEGENLPVTIPAFLITMISLGLTFGWLYKNG